MLVGYPYLATVCILGGSGAPEEVVDDLCVPLCIHFGGLGPMRRLLVTYACWGPLFGHCVGIMGGLGPLRRSLETYACFWPLFGHCTGVLGVWGRLLHNGYLAKVGKI